MKNICFRDFSNFCRQRGIGQGRADVCVLAKVCELTDEGDLQMS